MNKNELWQKIIHIAITILTAIATTFGVTSCMGMYKIKRCAGEVRTPLLLYPQTQRIRKEWCVAPVRNSCIRH